MVRFEKPRVFLLKSSWTSSTAVELFSWTKLQLSWASSAAAELCSWAELQLSLAFSTTVDLSQLQLNFNFNCEPLWPYTSWTCLRAVELGFSLLNSRSRPVGQLNWSLTPLTSNQQSASQTNKQVARVVRGGSTSLVNPVTLQVNLPVSLTVRLADSLPDMPGTVQPVLDRVLAQTASFEAPPIYTHSYLSPHIREHDLNSISNLRNTSHSLSHISCLSHFKSLERNLWVSLRAVVFVLHL
jgi:hypothetical protein